MNGLDKIDSMVEEDGLILPKEKAKAFLGSLSIPPDRIVQTPTGSILFEWHMPHYKEVDITHETIEWMEEIAPDKFIHY